MERDGVMTYLESVENLVEQFCKDPIDVYIDIKPEIVDKLGKQIGEMECSDMGVPKVIFEIAEKNSLEYDSFDFKQLVVLYELLAGSVNFCYWYGAHNVRPTGGGASVMYQCLDEAFRASAQDGNITGRFGENMVRCHMPLIEERLKYVSHVAIRDSVKNDVYLLLYAKSLQDFLDKLLISYVSFSKDMFLKRAFLLVHMLNRRLGLYEEFIHQVPVPADYQIPKMLEWFGVLKYSDDLHDMIWESRLIPSGSLQECEIRASTIMACKMLADEIGCTQGDIDIALWYNRKACDNPFHLTITTDY